MKRTEEKAFSKRAGAVFAFYFVVFLFSAVIFRVFQSESMLGASFLGAAEILDAERLFMLIGSVVALFLVCFFGTVVFLTLRRKKIIEKLYNFDEVTGIYSKSNFYTQTLNLLHANRQTKHCVASVDIYRFKVINEVYGRDFGDKVLKELAECIKAEFGRAGTYCRFGGDVFMVCVPFNFVNIERLQGLTDKLNDRLATGDIVLSIGVYVAEKLDIPVATMCDRAYMASRSIKGSYVNRFAMYDDNLRETLLEESKLSSHMKEGLEKGEFQVYLQPKYRLDTERIVGSEALIRWFHPQRGLITPNKFIPLFERNGLIFNLDIFVIESVCKILKGWKEQGKKIYPVSVNISRLNILQNNIAETIKDVVDSYGLDTSLLNLEITETAYIDNPELLNKVIAKLRSYGFVISIDDFGSGYSSLNTLKDVPVDILKIDLKFLLNFDKDSKGASILSSVVRMAKALSMEIVAEGVETKEQASFLRSVGCKYAQGYYYSKPVEVSRFEEMVEKQESIESYYEADDFISQQDIENFWENDATINNFLANIFGGFGIYEIKDGVINICKVNDGYYDLIGCTRDNYYQYNKNVLDRIHPADRSKVLSAFLKTLDSHAPEVVIYRRKNAKGQTIWLKSKICYIAGNNTHSLYYVYLTDISDQIKAEKELRINEIKHKIITNNLSDMIFEWNENTDTVTVCDRFKSVFGYPLDTIPQFTKDFCRFPMIQEDDREKLHNAFYRVYYGEEKCETECRIKHYTENTARRCLIKVLRVNTDFSDHLTILGIISFIC
ncbi:MAG TPA: EAL domain-containing protein [Clostridia bacterium]|nr:EAL domain-containing protein [Clostridia bacterium]HOL60632.1 EAL domain-containing protein [Clostridia bacterium]